MASASTEGICIKLQIVTKAKEIVISSTSAGNEVVQLEDGLTIVRKRKPTVPTAAQPAAPEPQTACKRRQTDLFIDPLPGFAEDEVGPSTQSGASNSVQVDAEASASGKAVAVARQQESNTNVVRQYVLAPQEPCDLPDWPATQIPTFHDAAKELLKCLPPGPCSVVTIQWLVEQALKLSAHSMGYPNPTELAAKPAPVQGTEIGDASSSGAGAAAADEDTAKVTAKAKAAAAACTAAALAARFSELLTAEVTTAQGQLGSETSTAAAAQRFLSLPPIIQAHCGGAQAVAAQRVQLAVLQEEEAMWQALSMSSHGVQQPVTNSGAADTTVQIAFSNMADEQTLAVADAQGMATLSQGGASMEDDVTVVLAAGNSNAAASGGVAPLADPLREAHEHVALEMQLRVESMYAVVEKAEALAAAAEQAASTLQAAYHQDAFRAYPHVNSPAWLIKQLSQQPEHAYAGL